VTSQKSMVTIRFACCRAWHRTVRRCVTLFK